MEKKKLKVEIIEMYFKKTIVSCALLCAIQKIKRYHWMNQRFHHHGSFGELVQTAHPVSITPRPEWKVKVI